MSRGPFRRPFVLVLAGALFTGGMLPSEAAARTPSKPSGVKVTSQVNALGVSWKSAKNAVSYTATAVPTKGSKKAKRNGTKSCTAIEPSTWCVIPNLVNDKKYAVKVVAKNGKKRSGASSTKFSIPRSAAESVIVTGTVTGGSTDGLRVVAVLPSGRTYSSQTLGVSGFFYFTVNAPNSDRVNATIHLIAANGTYLGPVVFNTRGAVGLGSLTDDNDLVDLGYVRLKDAGTWALTSKVPPLSNTAVSFEATTGRPAGAGLDGFVPTASPSGPGRLAAAFGGPRSATFDISACQGLAADGALGACWTLAKAQLQSCSGVTPDPATYNDLATGTCKDELGTVMGFVTNENPCVGASESYAFGGTLCWLAIRIMVAECGDDVISFGATIDAMSPACQTTVRSLLSGSGDSGGGNECGNLNLGGDDDGDGIINAIDVDDDNDGIVDPADPDANNKCSIEPTKSMRTMLGDGLPLNVGVLADSGESPTEFNARVNDLVVSGGFGIGYYTFDKRFFPGAYTDADGTIPAVWAECTGVLWCDPASSRALNGTNIEQRNNIEGDLTTSTFPEEPTKVDECTSDRFFMYYCEAAFDSLVGDAVMALPANQRSKCATLETKTKAYRTPCWSEVPVPMRFGSTSTACNEYLRYDQSYAPDLAVGVLTGKKNLFWQTVCQEDLGGGNMRTSQVLGASIAPNLGAMDPVPDVADAIHATDIVTLAYPTSRDGAIGRVATTIGAYPVTTPMVTEFGLVPAAGGAVTTKTVTYVGADGSNPTYGSTPNGGAPEDRAIVIGKDQKLQVTFYRPQRTSFQQEIDPGLPITKYHDLHGLNYGIQLEVGKIQFGCGPSTDDGKGNSPNGANQYTTDGSFVSTNLSEGGDTGAAILTPIKDNTDQATGGLADSAGEVPGTNTLTFTVDLAQCIAERMDYLNSGNNLTDPADQLTVDDFVVAHNSYHGAGSPTSPLGDGSDLQGVSDKLGQINHDEYTCIRINLAARGEAKTGGTDSAIQEMCIQFATDAFVGTNADYLVGRTLPTP